ncbi:MAG: hypothetical protein ACI4U5_03365 [Bacilli bacterium]
MLSIQGYITKSSVRRTSPKVNKKKNRIKRRSMGDRAKNYEEGVSGIGGLNNNRNKSGKGENKPASEGDSFKSTIFEKFNLDPVFFHIGDEYILKFISDKDIKSADIIIQPISVDGSIATIDNILLQAKIEKKKLKIDGNIIKNVKFSKNEKTRINIKLKNNLDYVLDCEVRVGGKDAKEL